MRSLTDHSSRFEVRRQGLAREAPGFPADTASIPESAWRVAQPIDEFMPDRNPIAVRRDDVAVTEADLLQPVYRAVTAAGLRMSQ